MRPPAMSNAQLKTRLYRVCLLVLAAGLCSAALVYATAGEDPDGDLNYVVVDGVAYPIAQHQTKPYVRTLEQFGGKASVLFDEFNRWFAGLWRGRALALTIACISTAVAIALFLFASWLPSERE
jgi:hypothetical protein